MPKTDWAISLYQPWASLMFAPPGVRKCIETRGWRLPDKYIGKRIAIHASARVPAYDMSCAAANAFIADAVKLITDKELLIGFRGHKIINAIESLPMGAVIGTVVFTACVPIRPDSIELARDYPYQRTREDVLFVSRNELNMGDYSMDGPMRWAWTAEKPIVFKAPIPAKGSQKIWAWNYPAYENMTGKQKCQSGVE